MRASGVSPLAELPDIFRYSAALERISERHLRRLIDGGQITALSWGLYRTPAVGTRAA